MQYQQFTPEMRKTHTILVPNMLPIHFRLLISIFGQFGYHMELLESDRKSTRLNSSHSGESRMPSSA